MLLARSWRLCHTQLMVRSSRYSSPPTLSETLRVSGGCHTRGFSGQFPLPDTGPWTRLIPELFLAKYGGTFRGATRYSHREVSGTGSDNVNHFQFFIPSLLFLPEMSRVYP